MKRPTCTLALTVLAASGARAVPVLFRYQGTADRVSVAGTFNQWNASATPMRRTAAGTWETTLDLAPGPYQYKFVLEGSRWVADPGAGAPIPPDGNSVVWVAPPGQSVVRRRGDNKALGFALRHDPHADISRVDRRNVRFVLQTAAGDVSQATLLLKTAATGGATPGRTMRRVASDGVIDTWAYTAPIAGRATYSFLLRDPLPVGRLDRNGFAPGTAGSSAPFSVDAGTLPLLETPAWVRDTVWYQVFPERFHNGDPRNDRKPPKGIPAWNTPLSAVPGNPNDYYWGGDLRGIIAKLPYLQSLGVNGLYLNPIFLGPDTHKYATTDYRRVDPDFGDEQTLKELVNAAHRHGMRVMLDGVFNHTSVYFPAFQDILRNQQASPYAAWYTIRRWPVPNPVQSGVTDRDIPYDAWWGLKWMPKLNTANPATRRFLLDVAEGWIREANIDAWRLDVANEVPHAFWKAFRPRVKAAKKDAYIVGEVWTRATDWLRGDQFDGVMNYPFRSATLDFFSRGTSDAATFARALETQRGWYSPRANAAMFNMLGSHDVPRLLTESRNDARRATLATVFQMTYPGAPSVYYGDEVGLASGGDPYNRAPMEWNASRWNTALLSSMRRAIAMRRANPALRGLTMETLYAPKGGRVAAFLRGGGGQTAVTVFNASETAQTVTVPLGRAAAPRPWTDVWRGATARAANGAVTLHMPAFSASVLVAGPSTAMPTRSGRGGRRSK